MTRTIGRYQVQEELGSGGMASVYLAVDPRFEREVAIKILPPDLLDEPALRARFAREAKVIASLEHPAIVPVYDFGEEDGQPYLVMRYMRGGTLKERMKTGTLPMREIEEVVVRISSALEAAHKKGIIHRDVKPANILYDTHGNPHLSDFGIVKLGSTTSTLTGESVIGTPAYMSPEQARGERTLDARTDVYSMGVVLYELLAGDPPYDADTPMGIAVKHVTDPVPDLTEVRSDLPAGFNTLIQRAMAKKVDQRFGTIRQLADNLQATIRGEEPEQDPTQVAEPGATVVAETRVGRSPAKPPAERQKPSRRLPLGWLAAGLGSLLVVALLAVGATLIFADGDPAEVPSPTVQEEVAQETSPSATPRPPTRTPAPTQAPPPPASVRADFQAAGLAPTWRWIREPGDNWSLFERPGWLTIQTEPKTLLFEGGEAPVLLRWQAVADFELVGRLRFSPGANFQAAGILAYADDDNFVSLNRAYCDRGPTCVGDGAYLDNDSLAIEGATVENSVGGLPAGTPILLRLSREGDQFVGEWSENGVDWQLVATTRADLGHPLLGLYATSGAPDAPSIPAAFDYLELRGDPAATGEDLSAWSVLYGPGQQVRIALLGPLAGQAAEPLRAIRTGAELALEDHGPLLGFPVVLELYETDCGQASGARAAQRVLEGEPVAAVLGPTCSGEVRGALPFLEGDRIPMVSASATRPGLADDGRLTFNRVILHSGQPGSREGLEANELESVQSFYLEVQSRTGASLPAGSEYFAAYSYDAMTLLLQHLEEVSVRTDDGGLFVDRVKLSRRIRRTEGFDGLTGPITIEGDGNRQP